MEDKEKFIFDVLDFAELYQQEDRNLFGNQFLQLDNTIKLDTDKPVTVIFSSDVHFGSIYTDLAKLKEILSIILRTENVFLVINGDYIDNFELPVPKLLLAGLNSQIISPAKQRIWFEALLDELSTRKKLLCVNIGNHEEFSNNDFVKKLLSKNVHISVNRAVIRVKVGNIEYTISLIHKSRFNSIINPIHSNLRELHLNFPFADIVCVSHTHIPSIQTYYYPDKEEGLSKRILVKTGTLKNQDPYTFKFFNPYKVSDISTPGIVLFPGKKKMLQFDDFLDAVEYLNMYYAFV